MRFDWGPAGLAAVGAGAAVVVVVDVLRFTTAVSVAIGRGAVVLPYAWAAGDAAAAYARRHGAQLAGRREDGDWSLSPTDLLALPAGTQLVLPSPNGSALAFGAADGDPDATVLAGCLRNATAVARAAAGHDGPVAVVAAGERWHGDLGPVRPAVEDLVGAGAVLRGVADGRRASGAAHGSAVAVSPEAEAAIAAFAAVGDDLGAWLAATASGASSRSGAGPTTWSPQPPSTPSRRSPCSTVPASSPWVRGDPWPSKGPEPRPAGTTLSPCCSRCWSRPACARVWPILRV